MPRFPIFSPDTRRLLPGALLLLLAIIAPTLCILWFMNAAVQNERLAVRQRLHDVYTAELTLRQKRLDDHWENVLEALSSSSTLPPPAAFEAALHTGAATILIFRDGQLAYPAALDSATPRLPEASALLFQIESLPAADPRRPQFAAQLATALQDYSLPFPSTQRLFLMQHLHDLTGTPFPSLNAEHLALSLAESLGPAPFLSQASPTLQPFPALPDYLVLTTPDHDTITLWQRDDLARQLTDLLNQSAPANTTLSLSTTPPPGAFLTIPAGRYLSAFTLSLTLKGTDPFAAAARRQEAAYVWAATLAIAFITLLVMALALYLRRQFRLTRLKNDLIATVSHELKTPLTSMRVFIDTLLEDRVPDPAAQREYLALIARENTRLSRLIDNFLTFSRMERRRIAFHFQPLNARAVAQSAIDAMGDRGTSVRLSVPPSLSFTGDADAIVTLLLNLLDNAWKYSPAEKQIELAAAAVPPGHMEFIVTDRGMGIPRRHHRRIFHRFYQVDQRLARAGSGCGLGLAIVKFIADSHHAAIAVASQPGRGSTFRVRFAACPAAPDLPPASQPAAKEAAHA